MTIIAGHECVIVPTESGRRWVAVCSCGYTSKTWATAQVAAEPAVGHVQKAVADLEKAGIPLELAPKLTFHGDPDRPDWWAHRVTDKALKGREHAEKVKRVKAARRASTRAAEQTSHTGTAS